MRRKCWKAFPLAAALSAGGCTTRSDAVSAPADDGAWMDGAAVTVTRDPVAGRETVTLTDPASGFSQLMSDEPLTAGAVETDDPGPAVADALATGLSS